MVLTMKTKLIFKVDDELHALILKEKERTGASMSEIIRRALKEYLKGGE